MTDEEDSQHVHEVAAITIPFLKVGYDACGIVPITSIEKLADLIYTVDIQFDGKFKTICYEWAYRHGVDIRV